MCTRCLFLQHRHLGGGRGEQLQGPHGVHRLSEPATTFPKESVGLPLTEGCAGLGRVLCKQAPQAAGAFYYPTTPLVLGQPGVRELAIVSGRLRGGCLGTCVSSMDPLCSARARVRVGPRASPLSISISISISCLTFYFPLMGQRKDQEFWGAGGALGTSTAAQTGIAGLAWIPSALCQPLTWGGPRNPVPKVSSLRACSQGHWCILPAGGRGGRCTMPSGNLGTTSHPRSQIATFTSQTGGDGPRPSAPTPSPSVSESRDRNSSRLCNKRTAHQMGVSLRARGCPSLLRGVCFTGFPFLSPCSPPTACL